MPRPTGPRTARLQPVALYRKLREALRHACAVPRGSTVLVACSGGPDSLALLLGLAELAPRAGVQLAVAHLDHGLRPGSSADARSVARRAAALGFPCVVERIHGKRELRERGLSGESGLRTLRREFLERARRAAGAEFVALGHTADDQAETILLRLTRGTGLRGLGGMRARRGRILRPLLSVRRPEVLEFLRSRRVRAREDASNRNLRLSRNRIRHRVLPELAKLNPLATEAITAAAEQLGAVHRLVERLSRAALERALAAPSDGPLASSAEGGEVPGVQLVRSRLLRYHPAIRESVLLHAWRRVRPAGPSLTRRHLHAVHELLERGVGNSLAHLPGRRVARLERGLLFLGPGRTLTPNPVRSRQRRPKREPRHERRRR